MSLCQNVFVMYKRSHWECAYIHITYTILGGYVNTSTLSLLCHIQFMPACPDINVTHGMCEVAKDYTKKKHTLRLRWVGVRVCVCVCVCVYDVCAGGGYTCMCMCTPP